MHLIKEVPLMHRTLRRGLLVAATMMVVSIGITATPVTAAPPSHSTTASLPARGLPSLGTGTCTLLWDLLNAGGRNGLVAIGLTDGPAADQVRRQPPRLRLHHRPGRPARHRSRSSASTSASRTEGSTASATPAASTR